MQKINIPHQSQIELKEKTRALEALAGLSLESLHKLKSLAKHPSGEVLLDKHWVFIQSLLKS